MSCEQPVMLVTDLFIISLTSIYKPMPLVESIVIIISTTAAVISELMALYKKSNSNGVIDFIVNSKCWQQQQQQQQHEHEHEP